ncbi:MAG: efflux RND transporter periplasmic adaptor subunit [Candidatus Hydrogenedentota bacterium]|jgi:Cu(I)/Ag(I) efflux system membrane fusion protein|nr:MAG: efflux RND transporter periplasmic adaptor subunit [Candidatus Hydrogenedentota bacterium]GIX45433.1 MAG: hypothetical protein KatS3mg130_1841 [Candidatus Sumerlaea sp.]
MNSGQPNTQTQNKKSWQRLLFTLRVIEVRLRFVAILIILGLAIGYWDYIENWYEHRLAPRKAALSSASQPSEEWFCPMHTFVVRSEPGKCPICGMPLTKRAKGEKTLLPPGTVARVQISPDRILQAGVRVVPVTYRTLIDETRAAGTIEIDEESLARITAWFPGRIDEQFVKFVGASVQKGEPLVTLYSPKFLAATQEFVHALEQLRAASSGPTQEAERARRIVEYARQRLLLSGFEPDQLAEIERTGTAGDRVTYRAKISGIVIERNALPGDYVAEGQTLFVVADLQRLWVQLAIPESQLSLLRLGMPVEITSAAFPNQIFYGEVQFVSPTVDPATRTVRARVVLSNSELKLKPGMFVTGTLRWPVGGMEEITQETTGVTHVLRGPAQTTSTVVAQPHPSVYYQCDMHPEVVSLQPGDCPKCGMHLTRREGVPPASLDFGTTGSQTSLKATASVYYQCDMCPDVISLQPGDCPKCGMHLTRREGIPPAGSDAGTTTSKSEVALVPHHHGASAGEGPWEIGYACAMHPGDLRQQPGICQVCSCGMPTKLWRVRKVLAVPELAVIDTGLRKIVYVEQAEGVYDAREIKVGNRVGAFYPVIEGLREGDRVAAEGAFLIDAESRLNPSASALYSAQYSKSENEPERRAIESSPSEQSHQEDHAHHH